MADIPAIVLPHGGYRNLIVYKKSDLIYEGTVLFCRRFLAADDKRQVAARDFAKKNAEWSQWKPILDTRPPETVANLMLTLCYQTRYLLDQMIKRQEEDFKKFGGVRERMHAARTAARGELWDKAVYSRLDAATSVEELVARATEIKRNVDQAVWSLKRRKGWGR